MFLVDQVHGVEAGLECSQGRSRGSPLPVSASPAWQGWKGAPARKRCTEVCYAPYSLTYWSQSELSRSENEPRIGWAWVSMWGKRGEGNWSSAFENAYVLSFSPSCSLLSTSFPSIFIGYRLEWLRTSSPIVQPSQRCPSGPRIFLRDGCSVAKGHRKCFCNNLR